MLAQGVPLGHSSIAVTSGFYAHLGEQLKSEAADAMDRGFETPAEFEGPWWLKSGGQTRAQTVR